MQTYHSIAVHIVTHNNQETIGACLLSLEKQSHRDYTICLIDNNSQDKTVVIAKKYKVDIVKPNTVNVGYAAGHNQAIRMTKSNYVLTLNPDVVLNDNFLKNMKQAFDRADDFIGSASGLLLRINMICEKSDIVDSAGLYMQKNRRQGLRYEGTSLHFLPKGTEQIFGPDGAAAFYRRRMLEDIKIGDQYFDNDFFMHKEDVDVCWRAQLRGWKSLFIPSAVCYHIRSFRPGKRQNMQPFLKMCAVRNRYYLLIKNEKMSHILHNFFPIILYDLGIFFYLLLFEWSSLGAYRGVVKNLKTMMEKRKFIQSRAIASQQDIAQWFI